MPNLTTMVPPRRLTRSASFVAVIAVMVLFQAASSAATPLYVVYQRSWHFSAATITLIFATFVFGLLCSLLTFGSLSDHIGRRPVLAIGIGLEALALLLFLGAGDVAVLLCARAVQGVATGMVLPALGATLVDVNPPHAPGRAAVVNGVVPIAGLALGSLSCGALVQYGPDPTHVVWILLLGALALALPTVLAIPEPRTTHGGILGALRPRVGIPPQLRPRFYALTPIIVASWALGGLYLSLGPSAAATIFGITNHFVGGLVATLLCGTGAVAAFVFRRGLSAAASRASVSLLAIGTVVTLFGVLTGTVAFAVTGTVLAGIGYGAAGPATFGTLATLAGPADPVDRGRLFAAAYTVAYLAFSVPAVVAGIAATRIGLHTTTAAYSLGAIIVGTMAAFRIAD